MPLCLAYSNSIHKMQGATLDLCEMDLGSTVFAEHQTYVALSRVKTIDGLFLTDFNPLRIKVNSKVREFYKTFLPIPIPTSDFSQYEYRSGGGMGIKDSCPSENESCPICIRTIVNPQITHCLHRFCYDCIMNHFNNTTDTTCPICRTSITLKEIIPCITNENKIIVPKPSFRKVVKKSGCNLNLFLEFQKSS